MGNKKLSKDEMLRVLEYIDNFVENIGGGSSYWIAPNGEEFSADVGYGYEFWKQIYDYLKRNGFDDERTT